MAIETSTLPQEDKVGGPPADLTKEYVASAGNLTWFLGDYIETLPRYISDIDRDFGYDIWRRMRRDPQVEASVSLLAMATLAQDVQVTPAISEKTLAAKQDSLFDYTEADVQDAKMYSAFVNHNLDNLDDPFIAILYELLLGICYGHKVAELIYKKATLDPKVGMQILLRNIKPKPQTSTAFVTDAYRNLLGLTYYAPGNVLPDISAIRLAYKRQIQAKTSIDPITGSQPMGDRLNALPPIVPPTKFIIFTFKKEDGDPRGNSILESSYHPYYAKGRVWYAYLAFMLAMAHPAIWGTTPDNAVSNYETDDEGNRIEVDSPEQHLEKKLEDVQNGSVIGAPGGTKFGLLQPQGDGRIFIEALGACDHQMIRGILYQSLAVEEGKHMARAASETHQDILGILIRYLKRSLGDAIRDQIVVPLILANFGQSVVDRGLVPKVSLGLTEHQDFAQDAAAIASLESSGYLHYSQYQGVDRMIGLPERDIQTQMEEIQQNIDALSAASAGGSSSGLPPSTGGNGLANRVGLDITKKSANKAANRIE